MAQRTYGDMGGDSAAASRTLGAGYLFGVPMGELGWFASLLMAAAAGFAAFFAATFLGIIGILIYNTATGRIADYAISYLRIGLPAGLLVLALALAYLGTMWVKRKLRRN